MGCTTFTEKDDTKEINKLLINKGFDKIIFNTKNGGNGFFCQLAIPDSKALLPVLITSSNIIGKNEIENQKKIEFWLNNTLYNISIDDSRKTFINEEKYNITIIEIKSEDGFETDSFLEIENDQNFSINKIKLNNSIGIIKKNNKDKKFEFKKLNIKNIDDNGYDIEYEADLYEGSIGLPIINMKNSKVLGFHKNIDNGILLKLPIKEFVEQDKKKDSENKNIFTSLRHVFTTKSTIKINEGKLNNEIGILYAMSNTLPVLKIFGEKFVKNNKDKCKMILYDNEKDEEKEYDLCSFLKIDFINSINSGRALFKVFLIQTDYFTDLSFMFFECFTLMTIENFSNLNTEKVTNMEGTFESCILLQEIEISNLNTSEVTDMSFMFEKCASLQEIDLSGWKTNKVKNMKAMFENCEKLETIIGLSNWDVSNVNNTSFMFNFCKNLISLGDISNWDTSNCVDMSFMFKGLCLFTKLSDISKWNTKNVKNLSGIFCSCPLIITVPDISNWNTDKVENISALFSGCTKLKYIPDISKWSTNNLKNMKSIFTSCINLTSIPDISIWNTKNVNIMSYVFYQCKQLKSLPDISKWNISNVTDLTQIFSECISLTSIPDISKWDIKNVIKLGG